MSALTQGEADGEASFNWMVILFIPVMCDVQVIAFFSYLAMFSILPLSILVFTCDLALSALCKVTQ